MTPQAYADTLIHGMVDGPYAAYRVVQTLQAFKMLSSTTQPALLFIASQAAPDARILTRGPVTLSDGSAVIFDPVCRVCGTEQAYNPQGEAGPHYHEPAGWSILI